MQQPAPPLDLLIAGGLTVDRFADGSSAAGGSVVHAGAAAASQGARQATLTVCGDEPEALAGLARLERHGPVVRQGSGSSVAYRHEAADGRRVLLLEATCDALSDDTIRRAPHARVALLAPIADELSAAAIATVRDTVAPQRIVLLIQGWLRELRLGEPVEAKPLDRVPAGTWAAFAEADAVVVSTEDLAESPDDPFRQAELLRRALGARPLVLVTLGSDGFLLDDPAAARIVASVPRRVIDDVPNVGAGDTFGAGLALALSSGLAPLPAAEAAAERVIAMLDARRG